MRSLTGSVRASVTVRSGTDSTEAGFPPDVISLRASTTLFSDHKRGQRTHRFPRFNLLPPTSAASSDQEPEDVWKSVEQPPEGPICVADGSFFFSSFWPSNTN